MSPKRHSQRYWPSLPLGPSVISMHSPPLNHLSCTSRMLVQMVLSGPSVTPVRPAASHRAAQY